MRAGRLGRVEDVLVCEEPLAIDLDCNRIAITMRTPGDDEVLALGFLHSEGLISAPDEIARVVVTAQTAVSDSVGPGRAEQLANVLPTPQAAARVIATLSDQRTQQTRRTATAACGVCGRQSIDDLLERCTPLRATEFGIASLLRAAQRLAGLQPLFRETGGLHGAAAFDAQGAVLCAYEDVGRHNAVDKVIGHLFREGRLEPNAARRGAVLAVSGRAGFEIVQKTVVARIPALVCVSAASSLAVELAVASNLVLAGFVRGDQLTIYCGADWLRSEGDEST